MKSYEEKIDDLGNVSILMTEENGTVRRVPNDPRNRDYAEYLRYTEWVEAGNNPEDFWTQQDDLATDTDL